MKWDNSYTAVLIGLLLGGTVGAVVEVYEHPKHYEGEWIRFVRTPFSMNWTPTEEEEWNGGFDRNGIQI